MNRPRIVTEYKPGGYKVGTCIDCVNNLPRCAFHAVEDAKRERERSAMLRRVSAAHHDAEIVRVCCALELESDEGGTREEKAARILDAQRV